MELSLNDLKELFVEIKSETPFKVGQKLFIRTVTYHIAGQVKEIYGKFLVLEKASWIADSGRFSNALLNYEFDEVEMFLNDVYLNIESITDATNIEKLPEVTK